MRSTIDRRLFNWAISRFPRSPKPWAIEIGTTRNPNPEAAESDGHSTVRLAQAGFVVLSVDSDERACRVARSLTEGFPDVTIVHDYGDRWLDRAALAPESISLVYLDAMAPTTPGCAEAHLSMFRKSLKYLTPDGIILIDDTDLENRGKARLVYDEAVKLRMTIIEKGSMMAFLKGDL